MQQIYFKPLFRAFLTAFGLCLAACSPVPADPSPPLSPEEAKDVFQLEPGFEIQLVAAEPLVQDPVVIQFDEDGRLWVVEMRSFMPDIDGKGELEPNGRICILEDLDKDGLMDSSRVFLDSLILPRAMALVKGGLLVAENKALWLVEDQDGDLQPDRKLLLDSTYATNGLPEHSDNGLWRGMDNWYYNAKSRLRYRLENGVWIRDSTEFRGQWGICHDDEGRLYYNYNWSQLHADLVPPNYLSRNKNHIPGSGIDHGLTLDRRVYPVRPNPAVNRGYIPGTLDSLGRLLEFTAACSPLVLRSAVFPPAFYQNVFVCEPSGNLVKRNILEENGFLLSAHDPHPGKEFLASSDERFRPVYLASGPDGALYVADMYRGLIQHGAYVTPYLREQTLKRNLVLPIHMGRIWRIVPEKHKRVSQVKMSAKTTDELVADLSHPDGWSRDMAQRLLVERNDPACIPALVKLAEDGTQVLARNHALWTLDGLAWKDETILIRFIKDEQTLIANTALRLLEPLAQKNNKVREVIEALFRETGSAPPAKKALQMALSAYVLDPEIRIKQLARLLDLHLQQAVMRDAVISSLQGLEYRFLIYLLGLESWKTRDPAREIFIDLLTAAVIRHGKDHELKGLLSLLDPGKGSFEWKQQAILNAMSIQGAAPPINPVKLSTAPALLTRSGLDQQNKNQMEGAMQLFDWPGKIKKPTGGSGALLNDRDRQWFVKGRSLYLNSCAGCHGNDGAGINRFAPTLRGSSWVTGNEKRLALLVLHGIEGPIEVNGKIYDAPEILPVMPSHSTMDDGDIQAILTYIRNEWGNQAGPVSRNLVGMTRHTTQGRVMPWTAEELNRHIADTLVVPENK
ncbi:MAG TPA: c-type cytochrome [Saprospiraceae bacterium]|nr:c-type cytochrome [Saprospiraceae bacterium]